MHSDNLPQANYLFEGYSRRLEQDPDTNEAISIVHVVAPGEKIIKLLETVTENYGEQVRCLLLNSFQMDKGQHRITIFPFVPKEQLMVEAKEFQDVLLNDRDTSFAVMSQREVLMAEINNDKILTIIEESQGETDAVLAEFGVPEIEMSKLLFHRPFVPKSNRAYYERYARLNAGLSKICTFE